MLVNLPLNIWEHMWNTSQFYHFDKLCFIWTLTHHYSSKTLHVLHWLSSPTHSWYCWDFSDNKNYDYHLLSHTDRQTDSNLNRFVWFYKIYCINRHGGRSTKVMGEYRYHTYSVNNNTNCPMSKLGTSKITFHFRIFALVKIPLKDCVHAVQCLHGAYPML